MSEKSDRKELERRLAQARRMVAEAIDPLTKDRLAALIRDIEEQLR
jgi:TATA-binding protein-associated factor Taf7